MAKQSTSKCFPCPIPKGTEGTKLRSVSPAKTDPKREQFTPTAAMPYNKRFIANGGC